jgi:DNA-binding transcriptional LysR family regulator
MTAAQLRAFLALADGGSFVAAAQTTGLSQPALHRSVGDLEEVTGHALVERRGRGVALTAAGKRLARGIRLAAAEIAAAIVEARPDAEGSRIVIGTMPLSRAVLVPRALARLLEERPGLSASIVEGSWRELVEPLREGQIDLMIGALRPEPLPDLDQVPLQDHHVVVVAGARHPLADADAVPLEQLAAFPWIVGIAGSPLRAQWDALFAGHAPPQRPVECGSVMVIRGLLAEGEFLTLLSPEQIALEVESGVLAVVGAPLADSVRRIGVTTRRDWRPTTAQRRFLDHLRAVALNGSIQESE